MMKAHPYSFLTLILITLTFLFSGPALADNIDATLPDSDNTSSFQVKNSESSNNLLMKVQSGGNVGIGTETPSSKLHLVDGTFMIHNGTADLSFEAGLPSAISSWNGLDIKTMATSRLRIETSGNVGIGTTDPKEKFQIGDRLTFHDGGWKNISYNSYYSISGDVDKRIASGCASAINFRDNGDISFRTAPTGAADSDISDGADMTWNSDTPPLIVKNDGKVGIGTSSPNSTLHVNGSFSMKYTPVTSDHTVSGDTIIGVNTASSITITIPTTEHQPGRIITIKNETDNSGTGLIVITPASGFIDGNGSYSIDNGYDFVQLYSNGTNWLVIAKSYDGY